MGIIGLEFYLDRNDVPSAWLYGQDHLWATSHLVSSPGRFILLPPHPPPHPPTHPSQVTKSSSVKQKRPSTSKAGNFYL